MAKRARRQRAGGTAALKRQTRLERRLRGVSAPLDRLIERTHFALRFFFSARMRKRGAQRRLVTVAHKKHGGGACCVVLALVVDRGWLYRTSCGGASSVAATANNSVCGGVSAATHQRHRRRGDVFGSCWASGRRTAPPWNGRVIGINCVSAYQRRWSLRHASLVSPLYRSSHTHISYLHNIAKSASFHHHIAANKRILAASAHLFIISSHAARSPQHLPRLLFCASARKIWHSIISNICAALARRLQRWRRLSSSLPRRCYVASSGSIIAPGAHRAAACSIIKLVFAPLYSIITAAS